MKVRDSGMPEYSYWESLFDIALILDRMEIGSDIGTFVEFGSGYGTFTIPVAKRIVGKVVAFDIEPEMISMAESRVLQAGLANVEIVRRDLIAEGTGLADLSVDYVALFNILHHDSPEEILAETFRILKPGGKAGIIHWNFDPKTPRGPSLEIRPRPDQMKRWVEESGFEIPEPILRNLPPWHYGILARKRSA